MALSGKCGFLVCLLSAGAGASARAQVPVATTVADSVSVRFLDIDLRAMIQALGSHLPKPVLAGSVPEVKVSLETPAPVSRETLAVLLAGLVRANGLEFSEDSAFYHVRPPGAVQAAAPQAGPVDATAVATASVRLFVIRLKHARAGDVAATVNLLFGRGGEFTGRAGLSTGTLADELARPDMLAPPDAPPAPPDSAGRSHGANLAGPVAIVPDQLTNSLLVRAAEADFLVLRDAVDQLDIRPLQVLIEVLIVEARHDRRFSLGADLLVPPQDIGDGTIGGTLTGGGLGDLVIRLMNLGKGDIDAVLRTAQSKGDVEIVSRPVLLASNNTEARFLVGSQRPFVQVSRSLPTDSPTRDQVVQYLDVGTKLSVLPTINQDGYVSLVVQQEINAATGETQFDAPVISTREASTQVLVRDGQTIVIGGLRDQQRDRSQSGVPVLSGIPIVGGLFGSSRRTSTATELYLFLTPRILRTDTDADKVTSPRLPEVRQ